MPLVVALAGLGQDRDSLRRWLPIEPVADQNGFAVACPEAVNGKWSYWRGGGGEEVDGVGFIAAVVEALVKEGVAEPGHVYVTGISRGALMSWTLACERPDLFAAAAPAHRLISVPETMAFWWRLNGCTGETAKRLPHRDRDDRTRTELCEWTGCAGSGPVRLYRVASGGHVPPSLAMDDPASAGFGQRGHDIETAQEVWNGFAAAKPLRGQ